MALVRATKRQREEADVLYQKHKDDVVQELIDGAISFFGNIPNMASKGYVWVTDELGQDREPLFCKAFLDSGVPAIRLLATIPKDQKMLEKLGGLGIQTVLEESDLSEKNVVLAYVGHFGDKLAKLKTRIDFVNASSKDGLVLAFTLLEGEWSLTRQILSLTDFMESRGFKPLNGDISSSTSLFCHDALETGTLFWVKPESHN